MFKSRPPFRRSVLATSVLLVLQCSSSAFAQSPPQHAESESYVRTIYLIRHGAYGEAGKLNSLGIAQARLVAARLRGLPSHFDTMVSSTLDRAIETAAVIHEQLPEVPWSRSDLLSECQPPLFEQKPDDDELECKKQLDQAFQTFFKPSHGKTGTDVLVAHGNVIRYLVTKALGVDTRSWATMVVAHTSVTVIQVGPNGYSIRAVGDIGHVPPDLQSVGDGADPLLVVPKTAG